MNRKVIATEGAPKAVAAYSQGIVAEGKFLFVAGQLGLDPATSQLTSGVEAQTGRALLNLQAIVEAAGATLQDVVKVTVLLHDINDFAAMNKVYAEFFTMNPPARAAFGGLDLPLGALVEIECIAVVP
ncbi:MAG: Rid family detoxifying hydrolase [Chloroflexi bacterium]|nr:Rid family detoxifying hydrolase [Chloroflexota bacterium]